MNVEPPACAAEHERGLDLFGSRVRILAGIPRSAGAPAPELAALGIEALLRAQHRVLTRFDPASELSCLNAAAESMVAASPTMLAFLGAARWAARRTGGLVDATVIDAVEAGGYETSFDRPPADLALALAIAPARRPAIARDPSPWSAVELDPVTGTVTRPPGLRFDSGGITKGHAADLCAERLAGLSSFAVDCGGDLRVGGVDGLARTISITDPFSNLVDSSFELDRGAVATSGIAGRLWIDGGRVAHHLIDPGRGLLAWTGLVQATAIAPSALEAEAVAKAALLSGPDGAGEWLERWGGVVFDDRGGRFVHGPLAERLRTPPIVAEAA